MKRYKTISRLLPLLTIILCYLSAVPAEAQIERYFRKSVSLFRIQTPDDMTLHQGEFIHNALLDKLRSMGRFDYNPIPIRPGISLERLFETVKEYSQTHQLDRAAKQFELMDEHYKEERITGETLDKIIAGAYIIIPRVVNYSVGKNVEKDTDKEGNESWEVKVSVSYSLKLEIWNAENQGTEQNPRWEPYLEAETSISTTGSKSKTYSKKVKKEDISRQLVDDAVKNSLFLLKLQMGKSLKKLDMFTVKAAVTDRNLKRDIIKFDFGRNVGLHIDDPFKVVYYERLPSGDSKKVDVAFMKVRRLWQNESQAQLLILHNPEGMRESEIINPGDQVIEHPKMGLNFTIRSGYAPYSLKPDTADYWMYYDDGHDEYEFESDQGEISSAIAIVFGWEFDIAPYTGSSELYLYNDYTLLLNHPMWGGLAELGFRKKFYKRRLGAFYGASAGVFAVTGKIGEVPFPSGEPAKDFMLQRKNDWDSGHIPIGSDIKLTGWSIGANLTAGLNYLLSPEAALTFEGGYRLYPKIDGGLWTIEAEYEDETWEMEIDEFEGEPAPADISGFWGAVGIVFSL